MVEPVDDRVDRGCGVTVLHVLDARVEDDVGDRIRDPATQGLVHLEPGLAIGARDAEESRLAGAGLPALRRSSTDLDQALWSGRFDQEGCERDAATPGETLGRRRETHAGIGSYQTRPIVESSVERHPELALGGQWRQVGRNEKDQRGHAPA
jgi:hypothetical protein